MAAAIRDWLAENCRYTLEVDYPPAERDFVSYFLLDSREGYCSYFASAMAVLCRAAGLPASTDTIVCAMPSSICRILYHSYYGANRAIRQ